MVLRYLQSSASERFDNAIRDELVEAYAGNNLDNTPQNISGYAIVPCRSRLIRKRQLRQFRHELGERLSGVKKVCSLFDQSSRR